MGYVDISLPRLAIALGFIVAAMLISRGAALRLGRELAWGAARAALQLIAIGYLLRALFANERPGWVLLALTIMLLVAAWTSARRLRKGPASRALLLYALASIAAGATVALVPVFVFIVPPKPWFEARYLVPIGGMMLSSSMNVVAQVLERLFASARAESATIEQLLALGATPQQALAPYSRAALRAAMIPTINGLLTVGLVSLPGMMTGQIVGGVAPEQAVRYQIVIMYQLVATTAISGALAAMLSRRLLFTPAAQLIVPPEPEKSRSS
ncbi:MAG: iron export ABC transporter permease subunit FetB [Byssovorax sp.]